MASRSREYHLYRAVETGDLIRMNRLLRRGADPNGDFSSPLPLCLAVGRGRLDIVESLLTHGADPNHNNMFSGRFGDVAWHSPLVLAVNEGRLDIVNALLRHGADPHSCRGPAPVLSFATALGRIDMVSTLKTHCSGSIVGQAVFAAVKHGHADILSILLEGDTGSVDCVSPGSGHTPLMIAAKTAQQELMFRLLGHGADVNAADTHGNTPLIHAMCKETDSATVVDIVHTLLEHRADATKPNLAGESPLAFAAEIENAQVCRLLRDRGADPNRPDMFLCRPIDIARRRNNAFLRSTLENAVYVQDDPVCAVCMDTMSVDDDDAGQIPTCGHRFHVSCFVRLERTGRTTCPTCSARIPTNRLISGCARSPHERRIVVLTG